MDFGDAPTSYGTLRADDGAQHQATDTGPFLGEDRNTDRDTETDAQSPLDGTGDNVHGNDDEKAVDVPPLVMGTNVTVTVQVGGGSGKLDAWIDFDQSGTFDPKPFPTG